MEVSDPFLIISCSVNPKDQCVGKRIDIIATMYYYLDWLCKYYITIQCFANYINL